MSLQARNIWAIGEQPKPGCALPQLKYWLTELQPGRPFGQALENPAGIRWAQHELRWQSLITSVLLPLLKNKRWRLRPTFLHAVWLANELHQHKQEWNNTNQHHQMQMDQIENQYRHTIPRLSLGLLVPFSDVSKLCFRAHLQNQNQYHPLRQSKKAHVSLSFGIGLCCAWSSVLVFKKNKKSYSLGDGH